MCGLVEMAGPLKKRAYDESDVRSKSPEVVVLKATKTLQDVSSKLKRGLASQDEGNSLVQRVDDTLHKLEQAAATEPLKPNKAVQAKINELSRIKDELENGNHYATEKLPSSLSRKEKAVVRESLEVAHRVLSRCNCGKWEECYNAIHAALLREVTPGKKE